MPTAISLKQVSKTFPASSTSPKLAALKDINLEVEEGEFFVIIGASGSGKSTLLRIMSGLETADRGGEVALAGAMRADDLGFVFQHFAILPWLTVFENVELNLLTKKLSLLERTKAVKDELQRFGLADFAKHYPRELSGGMRQRVGLARAFVRKPKIIFMDEPFSELDSFTAEELRKEFLRIWRETKETVVMVTHLVEEAVELGDRIAVLTPRPGSIEKIVVNNLPRPRQKRSEEFFRLEDELYKLVRP